MGFYARASAHPWLAANAAISRAKAKTVKVTPTPARVAEKVATAIVDIIFTIMTVVRAVASGMVRIIPTMPIPHTVVAHPIAMVRRTGIPIMGAT